MFEVPAVYDSRSSKRGTGDQCHAYYRRRFLSATEGEPELGSRLEQLIESDAAFSETTEQAYALSWALTFYLTQRHPAAMARYVSLQTQRKFGDYPPAQRRKDFIASFNAPPEQIARALYRYVVQHAPTGHAPP